MDRLGSRRWHGWRIDPTGRDVTQPGARRADVRAASAPVTVRQMCEAERVWLWIEPTHGSCAGCAIPCGLDSVAWCPSLKIVYCEACADARGIVPR